MEEKGTTQQPHERRVLVLYAHPLPHKSKVNRRLAAAAEKISGVTVRHLYELYPDFIIDVEEEQRLLSQHEVIVFQHPMYWYSAPALVKEWLDHVLTHGWAYGEGEMALKGRIWLQAVTCGGALEVYRAEGTHGHPVRDFLLPFEKTAHLCGMTYLPPTAIHHAGCLSTEDIENEVARYVKLLTALRDGKEALHE
jgi:glutathione-regulated potassium-efflux system ancillary protein KefG